MTWNDILTSPFVWGLALGLGCFCVSAWNHFKTKRELRRYQKHLSDKLELEATQIANLKKEKEALGKENENLRVRTSMLAEKPDQKILRDLEIMTRAEKRMILRAPGFAPAWEAAKSEAADEIAQEEIGKAAPKRWFNKLFGNAALKLLDSTQSEPDPAATPPAAAAPAAEPKPSAA